MKVAVVGAGLSGLLCAGGVQAAGHEVVVLDKGRSVGGRLATRRIAGATLDHGAQFFTVRDDRFAALVDRWVADGVVAEWCRGFGPAPDGHPRFLVPGGMNALAKHLAVGVEAVRCGVLAFAVRPGPAGWEVVLDDASVVAADAVVLTTPVAQAYSLLVGSGLALPDGVLALGYDPTLALLAVLDGPSAVPVPGGVQLHPDDDEVFSWVADNARKGISAVPAVTLHARPPVSAALWEEPPEEAHARLLVEARRWFGPVRVVESHLKRWRFALPTATWPDPCVVLDGGSGRAPVVLAGDAFGGPRVEGAALSGLAAAAALR